MRSATVYYRVCKSRTCRLPPFPLPLSLPLSPYISLPSSLPLSFFLQVKSPPKPEPATGFQIGWSPLPRCHWIKWVSSDQNSKEEDEKKERRRPDLDCYRGGLSFLLWAWRCTISPWKKNEPMYNMIIKRFCTHRQFVETYECSLRLLIVIVLFFLLIM